MVVFYFSGTGNTKYIAKLFSSNMNADCFSIEENLDFPSLVLQHDVIAFCYPVYGSRVPCIMRDFAISLKKALRGKKLIIFCTQYVFSGDGARAFADLLPDINHEVLYAEHFLMPNNVPNIPPIPVAGSNSQQRYLKKTQRKMETVCRNIQNGIVIKRGFNPVSKTLGLSQGLFMPGMEAKAKKDVRVDEDCTLCGACVSLCPMKNLHISENKIMQNGSCTLCYRCVNNCPQKSITAFTHKKVKKQYLWHQEI